MLTGTTRAPGKNSQNLIQRSFRDLIVGHWSILIMNSAPTNLTLGELSVLLGIILHCVFCWLYFMNFFNSIGYHIWVIDPKGEKAMNWGKVVISREGILFYVRFIRVRIEVRIIPSCKAIQSFTNHSYSCRGGWLGGESGKRTCHKDDSKVHMIVTRTNLCGSLGESIAYLHKWMASWV